MKRINLKNVSETLTNQEMKNVAGGNDPHNPTIDNGTSTSNTRGMCCDRDHLCCWDFRCSTNDICVEYYGAGAYCQK